MTAYRVGNDGSCANCDCSYFAPTMRFALTPGMKFTYHGVHSCAFVGFFCVFEILGVFALSLWVTCMRATCGLRP